MGVLFRCDARLPGDTGTQDHFAVQQARRRSANRTSTSVGPRAEAAEVKLIVPRPTTLTEACRSGSPRTHKPGHARKSGSACQSSLSCQPISIRSLSPAAYENIAARVPLPEGWVIRIAIVIRAIRGITLSLYHLSLYQSASIPCRRRKRHEAGLAARLVLAGAHHVGAVQRHHALRRPGGRRWCSRHASSRQRPRSPEVAAGGNGPQAS